MKLLVIFLINLSCTTYQIREYVKETFSAQCKSDLNQKSACADDEAAFNKYQNYQRKYSKVVK